jgi:heat shock protein HslJ
VQRRLFVTVAVLGMSLSACSMIGGPKSSPEPDASAGPSPSPSQAAPTPSPAPAGLDDREFVAVLVTESGKSKVLVSGSKIRLSFPAGSLSASAGCNNMSGSYEVKDGALVVGQMATTDMGCQADLMNQDQWLANFLSSKPAVSLDGNNLVLTSDSTEITFLDREQAEPDQPLVGITWGLTSILEGETASSVPSGVMATLLFKDDGTVQIYDGCNSGGGNYTADQRSITLSQVVSTQMACGGDKDEIAAAIRQVLGAEEIDYSIDHATLALQAGEHGLQYDAAVDVSN